MRVKRGAAKSGIEPNPPSAIDLRKFRRSLVEVTEMPKFGMDDDSDRRTINDFDTLIGMLSSIRSDLAFRMEIIGNAEGDADYMRGLLEAVIEGGGIK